MWVRTTRQGEGTAFAVAQQQEGAQKLNGDKEDTCRAV